MKIVNESNKNIAKEIFTSTTINSCETDAASCGVGN